MIHQMKLKGPYYQKIKVGTKTIEMRLNDEKRQLINVGDYIEFTNLDNQEVLKVSVVNLHYYRNFAELYVNHDKVSIGYAIDEEAKPEDMSMFYSLEDINKYGVVGIEVKK